MAPSTATPNIMTDAGYLFIAPLASTLPTNTVAGSVFTDSWPVAWLSLGATEAGNTFNYGITVTPVYAAEFLDPIKQVTTDRQGSISFVLIDHTLTNLQRATNGGIAALAATSGSTTTSLFTYEPPNIGAEVRCMIGWESLDNTVRMVARQTIQGGQIAATHDKSPAKAGFACEFHMEIPSAAKPWIAWSAGVARG